MRSNVLYCTACGEVLGEYAGSQDIGAPGVEPSATVDCCMACREFVAPVLDAIGGYKHKLSKTINILTALYAQVLDSEGEDEQ